MRPHLNTQRRYSSFQAEQAHQVCCSWTDALTKLSNSFYPALCSRPSDWTAISSLCSPNPLLTPSQWSYTHPMSKTLKCFQMPSHLAEYRAHSATLHRTTIFLSHNRRTRPVLLLYTPPPNYLQSYIVIHLWGHSYPCRAHSNTGAHR